jgi:predicted nucleic acid-binding protein
MVLVDTTVWVDHLRAGDKALAATLDAGVTHPFVIGEIALGQLNPRDVILRTLSNLPKATVATDAEVLAFIDAYKLFGLGIGYVDVHLLAAVQLDAGTKLWTRDKRLRQVAERLDLAVSVEKSP